MKKKESNKLFYYMRDNFGSPRVTVCLIDNGTYIARGVAICSSRDQPHKKVGRSIAAQRAMAALDALKPQLKIKTDRAQRIMILCDASMRFKSHVAKTLRPFSPHERYLIKQSRLTKKGNP